MDRDRPKRVLVAPLDWGLGHASRCVPVVRALRAHGAEVLIAGQGPHAEVLREEFPGIRAIPLVNYGMTYAATRAGLALRFPFMVARVYARAARERRELESIIDKHNIDTVISDQRFGCRSRKARCVCISHQLCVKMPPGFGRLERLVAHKLRAAAERFDELWIPDYAGEPNLTGDLTRKYPLPRNHKFVGPLSRFGGPEAPAPESLDLLVILSGPEPQRTAFERIALSQVRDFGGTAAVVLGRPGAAAGATVMQSPSPNVRVYPHLPAQRIESLMCGARAIACRGGYTTIMELVSLGKTAFLVPTPGQTEQEYLCERLSAMGWFASARQSRFDVHSAMSALAGRKGFPRSGHDESVLEEAVSALLCGRAKTGYCSA